jgi:hypothetical protein
LKENSSKYFLYKRIFLRRKIPGKLHLDVLINCIFVTSFLNYFFRLRLWDFSPGLPDFFGPNIPKRENIPNDHKLNQIRNGCKYSKWL